MHWNVITSFLLRSDELQPIELSSNSLSEFRDSIKQFKYLKNFRKKHRIALCMSYTTGNCFNKKPYDGKRLKSFQFDFGNKITRPMGQNLANYLFLDSAKPKVIIYLTRLLEYHKIVYDLQTSSVLRHRIKCRPPFPYLLCFIFCFQIPSVLQTSMYKLQNKNILKLSFFI